MATNHHRNGIRSLPKALTGITGLDEITGGGLPRGRPTLICGSAGCGKTLLAMEFLVRGATQFNEPGVFMSFEETEDELTKNVRSLGFDLKELSARKKLLLDHVGVERSEIEETGEYDLEGLFIRLGSAIDAIGAKRVALDTIESLFGGLSNQSILRAELRRLFRWLKDRGVTAIITGERGDGSLTRHGLEEYVSDCVILLDHHVSNRIPTRLLRIIKYRGSLHGRFEYPFVIGERGISVLPITSVGLNYGATNERVSTGVGGLDAMLGGKGFYRGSSVLISGTPGTGKTSLATHFVEAACRRGERSLYFAFEESQHQIIRNVRSIGINLEPWMKRGLLKFHPTRPTIYGLEMHLADMHKLVDEFRPKVVVLDPITSFITLGSAGEVRSMLVRLLDYLKMCQITTFLTSLTTGGSHLEHTETEVSSLMDTWLLLRDIEIGGERNHGLYVLKSRGMSHSNQIRELLITSKGVSLVEAYPGRGAVLTGSARADEAEERVAVLARREEVERKRLNLERKRRVVETQIAALRAEFQAEEEEMMKIIAEESKGGEALGAERAAMMAQSRKIDGFSSKEEKFISKQVTGLGRALLRKTIRKPLKLRENSLKLREKLIEGRTRESQG